MEVGRSTRWWRGQIVARPMELECMARERGSPVSSPVSPVDHDHAGYLRCRPLIDAKRGDGRRVEKTPSERTADEPRRAARFGDSDETAERVGSDGQETKSSPNADHSTKSCCYIGLE